MLLIYFGVLSVTIYSMSNEPTFTVYILHARDGYTLPLAAKEMARIFNISDEKKDAMVEALETDRIAISGQLPYLEARKIADKVESCGFEIELEPSEIVLHKGKSVYEEFEEKQEAKKKILDPEHSVMCPKCFHRQSDRNTHCEECGYLISRY